jgi:hypothetical protein
MSDKELLGRALAILGGIEHKLKVAKSRVTDEHLNSAWSDVAGLEIMIRNHLRSSEYLEREQQE